jgi:Endonuclease-reverse transcriptase
MGRTQGKQPRSAIYVNKRSFTAAQVTQLPFPSADITAIQVTLHGTQKPSLFINVYNPCNDNAIPALQQYIEENTALDHELIIIAGDFNCHHPVWNPAQYTRHDEEADKLIDLATDLGLNLLIPPGTVTYPNANTAIDLVWANEPAATRMMKCRIALNHDLGSDHLPIETALTGAILSPPETLSRNYDRTDWEKFNKVLSEQLPQVPYLDSLWSQDAIDTYTEKLTVVLTNAIDATTPYRKPSPHSKRWWDPKLTQLHRQANRERNLYRRTCSPIDRVAWEEKAKDHTAGIAKAKKAKWKDYVENADGKSIWQIKKYATNITTSSLIPTLDGNATTHEAKIETFTRAFFPQPPPTNLTDITQNNAYPLSVPYTLSITVEQIRAAVQRAAPKKAPGPDGIPNRVIRQALPLIECHLQALMQASLDMGYFP